MRTNIPNTFLLLLIFVMFFSLPASYSLAQNWKSQQYYIKLPGRDDVAVLTLNCNTLAYRSLKARSHVRDWSGYLEDGVEEPEIEWLCENYLREVAKKAKLDKRSVANAVLDFVQRLPYSADDVSTGFDEYPRYPAETLMDRGGDCEDTAILAATILHRLNIRSICILFPTHMMIGIDLKTLGINPDEFKGEVLHWQGTVYAYAETTGEGWMIGQLPSGCNEGEIRRVVPFEGRKLFHTRQRLRSIDAMHGQDIEKLLFTLIALEPSERADLELFEWMARIDDHELSSYGRTCVFNDVNGRATYTHLRTPASARENLAKTCIAIIERDPVGEFGARARERLRRIGWNTTGRTKGKRPVERPKRGAERTITNSVGMKLIWIPSGEFMMGSPSSEAERSNNEGPQHRVRISKGFWMGQTEVKQSQWKSVMGSNPSYFKGNSLPVENVSWNDAVKFCKKLSQRESKTYRLPTEAEWEYACRAGTTTPFNTGGTISTSQANYDGNYTYGHGRKGVYGVYRGKPTEVGSFSPNSFGLYDMHGNVWEWCSDWDDGDYYSKSPSVDPQGPSSGSLRVLRGGSWSFRPKYCRSAHRDWQNPVGRGIGLGGFRIVLDSQK